MSIFGFLKSAPNTVEKSVDALIATGDALVFTEEEKANNRKASFAWMLEFERILADQNSSRSLTRRYIATAVVFEWLLLHLVSVAVVFFDADISKNIFDVANNQNWVVGLIAAFYFAPHMIGRAVQGAKK